MDVVKKKAKVVRVTPYVKGEHRTPDKPKTMENKPFQRLLQEVAKTCEGSDGTKPD